MMTIPSKEKTPIRVLFLDHTAKLGGGEIALANLVRHLDRKVVCPIVLLFTRGPLQQRLEGSAETHVLSLAQSVLETKKDSLGLKSLLQVRAIWLMFMQSCKVAHFARKMNIDLIHTNSLKADIIGSLAAKMAGIPIVWHVRDRIEPDYLPEIVVRLFRFLSRSLPDFVIANSSATLATLHLNGKRRGTAIASGIDPDRMRVVHDGCNVTTSPDSGDDSGPTVQIGLIGRISPWKGQEVFIKAAALVHQRHPQARFQIIGAPLFAERDYEVHLHHLCAEYKLERVVEFVGFVENVPDRIALLDIVVHASTTGEPFGQVIIEGMAEQKPVIATDGGGVPEIVQDGITGILVPMGDASRMAEAIDYLLTHPELAAEMGLRGRERVQSHFTIQKTARMVEAVYSDVLAS